MNNSLLDISYLEIDTEKLDKIFNSSSKLEKNSIFYYILNEYYISKETNTNGQNAHLCYLMSYLITEHIKPLNKHKISIVFADKAYEYMKVDKYKKWLEVLIKKYNSEV